MSSRPHRRQFKRTLNARGRQRRKLGNYRVYDRNMHLEALEDRCLLSLVPVTVAINELIQTRNPDGLLGGDGDYYALVTIGDHETQDSRNSIVTGDEEYVVSGSHRFPCWHFTQYVESSGGPVQIQIVIRDADGIEFGIPSDDWVDVSPVAGQGSLTLSFDPASGTTLTGNSQGNGDFDGDAQIFYEVYRSLPVSVAVHQLIQITNPDYGLEYGNGDYYARVEFNGKQMLDTRGFTFSPGDFTITPNWLVTDYVPASEPQVQIRIEILDSDSASSDDWIDINPASGEMGLELSFDASAGTTLSASSSGNGDADIAEVFYTITPGEIVWINRVNDDGFEIFDMDGDGTFNAANARAVVDAAIQSWDRTIADFHHPVDEPELCRSSPRNTYANSYVLHISVDSAAAPGFAVTYAVRAEGERYPTHGHIKLNPGPLAGWFVDVTPNDSSEFQLPVNAFHATPDPDAEIPDDEADPSKRPDFLTIALHEIGHAMGIASDADFRFQDYCEIVEPNEADGPGQLWVFQSPVESAHSHLMTTRDGSGATDSPAHTASSGITANGLSGADDLMNDLMIDSPGFGRRLIPNTVAFMLQDAYGYEIVPPDAFGTFYSGTFIESSGELIVRGRTDSGAGSSNDTILIRRQGDEVEITVTIGNDVPGTGSNVYRSWFAISEIDLFRVAAGDGSDTLIIDFDGGDPIPAGGLIYDGGVDPLGVDTLVLQGGSGGNVTYTAAGVTSGTVTYENSTITYSGLDPIIDRIPATDRVFIDSTGAGQRIRLRDNGDPNNNMSVIDSDGTGGFESITFVNPSSSLTIDAGVGNDRLTVGLDGSSPVPAGGLFYNGGSGLDELNLDDTATIDNKSGELSPIAVTGLAMGGEITYAELETVNVALGSGSNQFTIAGTHAGSTVVTAGGGTDVINIREIQGPTRAVGSTGDVSFNVGNMDPMLSGTSSQILGPLELEGDTGSSRVVVAVDEDFRLTDKNLEFSNGDSYSLKEVDEAILTGGPQDNTFDVSGWTGRAVLNGGGGDNQVVAIEDADFTLTDTDLATSIGANVTLSEVSQVRMATMHGSHNLDASAFSGSVFMYGGSGSSTLLGGSGENYLDGGTGAATLIGGSGSNVLVALNGQGSTIYGGAGSNLIYGSPYLDTIYGGAGSNRIYGEGGGDFLYGGPADDVIVAGSGNTTILGNGGSDILVAGDGDNVIYAVNPSGAGDDGKVNYVYGGPGNDTIHGSEGNDVIFGGGGANVVDGGGPGAQIYADSGPILDLQPPPLFVPDDWPSNWAESATLPFGPEGRGRWAELAGSGTNGGVSNSPGEAVEPTIVVASEERYVAWADSRTGTFQIYVAKEANGVWEELAGSASGSAISPTGDTARRPTIALNDAGSAQVAYTLFDGTSSDIYAMTFDPTAGGGHGDWLPLDTGSGRVTTAGAADSALLVNTETGPVVAWLDNSAGTTNVYVAELVSGVWAPLGDGAISGMGVSGSLTDVGELALTSDGTKVAVAWSQDQGDSRQIYVREFSNGAWSELAGSASAGGVSNSSAEANAPSLAYFDGALFAAWQDSADEHWSVYASRYDGTSWAPAGSNATTGSGVSEIGGQATGPKLAAGGGELHLVWTHSPFSEGSEIGTTIYARRWNGSAFVEELKGDASYDGMDPRSVAPQALAVVVDPAGHPFVAWNDRASGHPQVFVRGNQFELGTVYYVNDTLSDNEFTTAAGALTNDGLAPATPKPSVQAVLDAYTLQLGDVILADAGEYTDGFIITPDDAGVTIIGASDQRAIIEGPVVVQNLDGVILQRLNLAGGISVIGSDNSSLMFDAIGGSGVTLDSGTGHYLAHNVIASSATGIDMTGEIDHLTVEYNSITAANIGVSVTGTGATDLLLRGNRVSDAGTGIALSAASSGRIIGNDISATGIGQPRHGGRIQRACSRGRRGKSGQRRNRLDISGRIRSADYCARRI